jgi:elongation factor 1-alpha
MDSMHARFSRDHFEAAKTQIVRALKKVGYHSQIVSVLPVSGLSGDNLVESSDSMGWWKGPSLLV